MKIRRKVAALRYASPLSGRNRRAQCSNNNLMLGKPPRPLSLKICCAPRDPDRVVVVGCRGQRRRARCPPFLCVTRSASCCGRHRELFRGSLAKRFVHLCKRSIIWCGEHGHVWRTPLQVYPAVYSSFCIAGPAEKELIDSPTPKQSRSPLCSFPQSPRCRQHTDAESRASWLRRVKLKRSRQAADRLSRAPPPPPCSSRLQRLYRFTHTLSGCGAAHPRQVQVQAQAHTRRRS